tara:strand:+ start:28 stop:486 length:459 start_codon:yes stop_codon:yes gene_type:complete
MIGFGQSEYNIMKSLEKKHLDIIDEVEKIDKWIDFSYHNVTKKGKYHYSINKKTSDTTLTSIDLECDKHYIYIYYNVSIHFNSQLRYEYPYEKSFIIKYNYSMGQGDSGDGKIEFIGMNKRLLRTQHDFGTGGENVKVYVDGKEIFNEFREF